MKCDFCINKKDHSAGSWYAVAEGGDDPYNYEYIVAKEDGQEMNQIKENQKIHQMILGNFVKILIDAVWHF